MNFAIIHIQCGRRRRMRQLWLSPGQDRSGSRDSRQCGNDDNGRWLDIDTSGGSDTGGVIITNILMVKVNQSKLIDSGSRIVIPTVAMIVIE